MLLELTNFDPNSAKLKDGHRHGIWVAELKAFDKDYKLIKTYGFHSLTGDPVANKKLALDRATNTLAAIQARFSTDRIVEHWGEPKAVSWQMGMATGESAEMRKALVFFLHVSAVVVQ